MDIFEILQQYMVPVVFALCVIVGYVLKSWTPFNNNYINLATMIVGVIANGALNSWGFTVEVILGGAASALLASGSYEFVKNSVSILTQKETPINK